MGTLNNRFQYVWYGTCALEGEEVTPCKPYVFANELTAMKTSIEMISTFSTSNSNNSIEFYKPETDEGSLTQMNCGAMYCITLKEGKSISISGATAAGSDTIKSGENEESAKVSFTCGYNSDETPTPTEFVCIPDSFMSVQVTSQLLNVLFASQNQKFVNFETGNTVGVDPSYYTADGAPPGITISVTTPALGLESQIILTNLQPKADGGKLYLLRGPACYAGPYEFANGEWKVELVLVSGEEATPTPEPEPTPTPDEVDCSCAPTNFTTETVSASLHDTDYGVRLVAFVSGTQVSYDTSTLVSGGLGCTVTLKLPNGVQAGQLMLTSKKPSNTQFYVKHGAVCYTATATSSNASGEDWELTMVVSKTLSSDCGDTSPLATPTPVPDTTAPTATISGAPSSTIYPEVDVNLTIGGTDVTHYKHWLDSGNWSAETPVATALNMTATWSLGTHTVKVVGKDAAGNWQTESNATTITWQAIAVPSTECCPSSYTQITTQGGATEIDHMHTPEGGLPVAILKYQGFPLAGDPGTLCADLTLIDGWTEEATDPKKFVSLPGASANDFVGTITKNLKNGTDRSTFYYNDSNGDCYEGDYNDAGSQEDPIVLTKLT